mmetsp:Transcript_22785/g.57947  ORF Transcript_22785/g.57947 Transcript_22785/m.57947 type:complete len:249 (-) Transcript_22785:843-1589(-)|eukprot:CAMPEP_0202866548 /NCGR_PEP_ID=MMETSP1391-20130828/7920_1 /ASSEMBLY_ACC=CAM_ASM_000867 /TAXON_ID=1034604 /ORGANISM="Chlamydomonas leiostraca, Strain SAG 11-49" /LENGTH=248 /DNA_ID=CAMNT_0049546509 /DNA_START=135 /DNA_END=881 /DNA_ORIENTATION=+
MAKPVPDTLDHTIAFLQKREGIDKTLKLIRYTSRLVAAVSPKDSDTFARFSALEKSVGQSRKAYRLGKFLQDFNNLRKSDATGYLCLVELVAYGGEGIYYFIEQLVWLIKAGALSKEYEAQLSKISAWAELAGYLANMYMTVLAVRELSAKEASLRAKLDKALKEEGGQALQGASPASPAVASLQKDLAATRFKRALKAASMVQDLADSLIAINDIRGGKDRVISHPATLALAGLVSGSISFYKNWNT